MGNLYKRSVLLRDFRSSVTLDRSKQAALWAVCDQEMCTEQKIRVIFNEAYTTEFPLRFEWNSSHDCGKSDFEFKVRMQKYKRQHNWNPCSPNYLILMSSVSIYAKDLGKLMKVYGSKCLPIDGWERPFGSCLRPVWLGLPRHVYVWKNTKKTLTLNKNIQAPKKP